MVLRRCALAMKLSVTYGYARLSLRESLAFLLKPNRSTSFFNAWGRSPGKHYTIAAWPRAKQAVMASRIFSTKIALCSTTC